MPARLTPSQAAKLGIDTKLKPRTTRKTASGPYHTRCVACGEEFHTMAAEDRHVAGGHNRFELVLDGHAEVP